MMMMATATKGKRPLRHLTATDKIDAIQRIHDGESKASVARDIGVPESTLRGWCKNEEKLRYMSRQSVENAEKLSNEATAVALTAAAAAELFSGPPEKRLKLESAMFGGNGKLKYDDSFYKVAAAARGSLNGLDLSGGGGAGGGVDKSGSLGVSGGDIIMNGLAGASADFSQFAKTAAEISALSKSKAYGADLSKHHHHGGDPTKSDHHLSMAAISPLTSLSHLSGMSGLGQSPLALSFNDIATNLNLIAQLNNNHNLATMSSLAGGLNTAAAAAAAAQSLRNVRPKGSGSSAANNNGSGVGAATGRGSTLQDNSNAGVGGGGAGGGSGGGNNTDKSSSSGGNSTVPSLTVRNLAKLQQQKSSSGELLGNGMLHQQSHTTGLSNLSEQYRKSSSQSTNPATSTPTTTTTNASVGRDSNAAPVDDALWYWLKSQQAMLGLNNLYTALPRAASHSPPTPPPPMGLTSVTVGAGSPNHAQTTLPPTAHTPHTPPPPLVGPPLVSTPQPTPPSSAPSLTPEDTKNSSWFWQWYKTFGASLMPGGGGAAGGGAGNTAADSKQQLREQQQQQAAQQAAIAAALHHHNNNNSLSQQNQNNSASGQKGNGGSAAAAASLTAAYENILYSQLTKGSSANAVDTLNNNHHHHLNHHLSAHLKNEPMDLNMSGANDGDSKPEDLSNHHAGSGKDRSSAMGNGGDERRSRYHHNSPSRPSSASSVASSSMSAHGSRDGADHLMPPTLARASEDREDDEVAALDAAERKLNSSTTVVEATSTDGADASDLKDNDEDEREDHNESGQRVNEGDDAAAQEGQQQMPAKERKHRSGALKRRRCSSAELVEAKEALDNILFSGNSNDRCSTVSSVAASPPPPLLSMVVRGPSTSPVGTAIGELNGAGDGLLHLDGGKGDTTGDDAKSETSEDSNQRQSTLTPVTSVAVADIRNSAEAVEHGEKFLKWLEACSDPNVTAMQVMQFKYLLNSIKLSAERQLQSATVGSALAGNGPEERTRIRKRK
ncbi:protein distal antenna [Anopheles maculipalpis]|uniref:protein distal antenna n=1 Tax=Anopheles maculipalpis TaxID=1496333 RepID=UPI0021595561|nr:protein distal antenna [Anopheles maculipalpis]